MKILIIYTGGTIGMKMAEDGSLVPFDFSQIENEVPELKKFNFELDSVSFDPVDSSDIQPTFWQKLARVIETEYYKYDGFVILHGTDTMSYSASALSFMLENLAKPVIFTGSQLPIGMLRTDGKENLISAIETAAAQDDGRPIVPEVCIYFQNKLLRGNRTTKFSSEHFNAFNSFNYPALAEAGIHLYFNNSSIMPQPQGVFSVQYELNMDTAVLRLYPGITKQFVENIFNTANLRSVIMQSYGAGNAFSDKWFIDILNKYTERGINILNITQCVQGCVKPDLYATGKQLKKIGIIAGYDITFEAALSKIYCLQGRYKGNEEVKYYLQKSLRGEATLQNV